MNVERNLKNTIVVSDFGENTPTAVATFFSNFGLIKNFARSHDGHKDVIRIEYKHNG